MKMVPVLLGWYLYVETGSTLSLGLLGLSEVLPAILLALPAGVKADHSHKKPLILKSFAGYIGVAAILTLATSGILDNLIHGLDSIKLWIIFLMVGVTGVIRAYLSPAFSAILSRLIPSDMLVKGASINSMIWLLAAIIGPMLAGVLIGYVSMPAAFMIIMILSAGAFISFLIVPSPEEEFVTSTKRTWEGVQEGVQFVWQQKALLGAMGLDMIAILFGGVTALLPVFAKDILSMGPQTLGILMSATYLGNFISILYLTRFPLRGGQGRKLIYSVAGFGACIIVFAFSGNVVLSIAALFVSGLFDGVSVIIRGSIFQIMVPEHMRGRVSSVNSVFINSSNELGQFESGMAASFLGTVPSVLVGGTITLVVSLLAWLKLPSLRKMEY
jgi:MFS family permease